jgi:hypothetical protein
MMGFAALYPSYFFVAFFSGSMAGKNIAVATNHNNSGQKSALR